MTMEPKRIIAVVGATGSQGGGLSTHSKSAECSESAR